MDARDRNDDIVQIRDIETRRLRALVNADMDIARDLHADDFQLINPYGRSLSKDDYMSGIASGAIDYLVWEPVSTIEVRQIGSLAVIRYQSKLEIANDGQPHPIQNFWHTDSYEKRDGRWQVVWSQATQIQ